MIILHSAVRRSCQPVKEVLDFSNAASKGRDGARKLSDKAILISETTGKVPDTAIEVFNAAIEVSHVTSEVIQLRRHPIDTTLRGQESLSC